jgi:hypothetical protein
MTLDDRVTLSAGYVSHVLAAVLYVPSPHSTAGGASGFGAVVAAGLGVVLAGSELLEQASWKTPHERRSIQDRARIGVSFDEGEG